VLSLCPSLAGTGSSPQCRGRQLDAALPVRSAVSILRSESLVGVLMPRQHHSRRLRGARLPQRRQLVVRPVLLA
jgi:hypothetical protein